MKIMSCREKILFLWSKKTMEGKKKTLSLAFLTMHLILSPCEVNCWPTLHRNSVFQNFFFFCFSPNNLELQAGKKKLKQINAISSLHYHPRLGEVKSLFAPLAHFLEGKAWPGAFVSFHPVILSALHACALWCDCPLSSVTLIIPLWGKLQLQC